MRSRTLNAKPIREVMKTLVIHFARFGPYHYARLRAAATVMEPHGWRVLGLETAGTDATYGWDETKRGKSEPEVITAFPMRVYEEISAAECKRVMHPLLNSMQAEAVAIAGWGSIDARVCLHWCCHHDVMPIVMSETRAADGHRVWWKEWLKRRLIPRFEGALVGGKSHRDYLVKLGMPAERVQSGYNVVDNDYFREESAHFQDDDQVSGLTFNPYILASNRFVERKNLIRLIQAFAAAVRRESSGRCTTTDLCLIGDGPLRAALHSTCQAQDIPVVAAAPWDVEGEATSALTTPRVFLPGFRQIEQLPRFYAHACCFVHPAISEPWGLVINEAMACGLPVLCSANCGAAEELVIDSVNGFSFDPLDTASISRVLRSFLNLPPEQQAAMGEASSALIEQRYPTSAFGQGLATLLSGLSGP
jgi:1,2-diacylglycerol 3-alpha-glucosyltransferase